MSKPIYFICFFVLALSATAQSYTISGVITDTLNNPLPYANILAKPLSTAIKMAFAITDESGKYELALQKGESYTITISYLGFQPIVFEQQLTADSSKDFQLRPAVNELDEVVVNSKIAVVVKEDTIIYDPKIFTTGKERKLKQLLKKLPGVEVDKNGAIFVLGKRVSKLLVDGKTFFGGGTKLGVENIPADAVDQVEVLDNYSEIPFLKDVMDSDKMAVNIKLKKDKKRFVFGDIETGIGTDRHYLIHPNIFYYSPKTNINFIGDLNDIGVKSFTLKEYLDFEGARGKLFTNPASYFKLSNNEFSRFLSNRDFRFGKNKFGAINVTQAIHEDIDISSYAIFSATETEAANETVNQYIAEGIQNTENRTMTSSTNNDFVMAKLSLDFTPDSNEDISYSGFFKSSKNNNDNFVETLSPELNTNLNTLVDGSATTLQQNAEWHKKQSREHSFSLKADHHYNKNDLISHWLTDEAILGDLIPLMENDIYDINQTTAIQLHNVQLLFKHYWVLNNTNHIYTTIGNNYLWENYFTNDFQELADGSINNFNISGFGNEMNFKLNDLYFRLHYKFKTRNRPVITIKSGISIHSYSWQVNQLNTLKNNKVLWLPDFLTKIDFSKSEHLNFNYALRSTFEDAPGYASGFRIERYNAVTSGNENLENELYHSARLVYTKFRLNKGLTMAGSINFNKKIRSIRNQVLLQGINQSSQAFSTNNPETTWSFSTNLRKKTGKFTTKLRANFRFSDYLQIINNQTLKNKIAIQNFGVEAATNFSNWPNIVMGYNREFGQFSSANTTANYSNENPYINLEYNFLKDFNLLADYSRNNNQTYAGQKNRYELVNASLFYQKEDSPWGFEISATNLLNTLSKRQNTVSDYLISDHIIYILPRIVMFKISYKL